MNFLSFKDPSPSFPVLVIVQGLRNVMLLFDQLLELFLVRDSVQYKLLPPDQSRSSIHTSVTNNTYIKYTVAKNRQRKKTTQTIL